MSPATHWMSASVDVREALCSLARVKMWTISASTVVLPASSRPSRDWNCAPNINGVVLPLEMSRQLSSLILLWPPSLSPLHSEIAGGLAASGSTTAMSHSISGLARAASTYMVNSVAPEPECTPSMSHRGPWHSAPTSGSSPMEASISSTVCVCISIGVMEVGHLPPASSGGGTFSTRADASYQAECGSGMPLGSNSPKILP
mmetsp:Transcript_48378/g.134823  ORF Transcript_48378/g.134823 Transcript_48378/m.134823 type:complete len:202 (+) Transcript_48378:334-939(+)